MLTTTGPAAAARFPYDTGDEVTVSGVVTDATGKPLEGVDVVLEASRLGVQLNPPGRVKRDVVTGSTRTGKGGDFALRFDWDWRYNHFELIGGVSVPTPGGKRLQELARLDISRRVEQGSPVVVPLTISETDFLDKLHAFESSLSSADEKHVYAEQGKPDRVDQLRYPDRREKLLVVLPARQGLSLRRRPPAGGRGLRPDRTAVTMRENSPLLARRRLAPPPSPSRFLGLVGEKLVQTDAVFRRHLASDVPFIHHAGEYLAGSGGKRMRPALLLLTARLLGHDSAEEVTYAAVVEFIHTATLIHDDIIDHAALRRGQTTLNALWGNSMTVLLGDWLYTTAMRMALEHDNLEIIKALCEATLRMTEGELLTLQRLGAIDLTTEEYFAIIERKTAHLFAAACSIPCLMEPRRPDLQPALAHYGRSLGTCFQLVDDLLDFTARESELGKPVLSDLKEGKLTLPLILLLPRIDGRMRQLIEWVLEDRSFERAHADQILELVVREGTLEEVEEMAQELAEQARQALEPFAPSDAREALELAPDFVLHRRS